MLNHSHSQMGSSLIEVLVTLLVFTVGMLGLAALQLNALQGATDSAQRSQTTWILQDIAERIRANPEGTAGDYATAPDCTAAPATMCADHYSPQGGAKVNAANCTASQMAAFDRWEAQCSYASVAPFNGISGRYTSRDFVNAPAAGASLTLTNANNVLTIKGHWLSKAESAKGSGAKTSETTELKVQR
ncbi:type IV pilus modification protein PilV [Pseudomonas sp. MBLB4123]|uniref:type IV pilus modification protein PilV n=1 Tax=Pseudomonas sp. MBLB4123 TaxID=3451557 RepID=UPI003F751C21